MTKRYPLRRTLGGGDSGDPGDLEGIPFGIFQFSDSGKDGSLHVDKALRFGRARGHGFRGDVHHLDFAAGGVVGKFGHEKSLAGGGSSGTVASK